MGIFFLSLCTLYLDKIIVLISILLACQKLAALLLMGKLLKMCC